LARDVLAVYLRLELLVLQRIVRRLSGPDDSPAWAADKLRQLEHLRLEVQALAEAAAGRASGAAADAVAEAYRRGAAEGARELGEQLAERLPPEALALARAAGQRLVNTTGLRVSSWAADVYRAAVQAGAEAVVSGVETRRQASARMVAHLSRRGITGYTDRAGRNWDLATYAEMSVRTSAGQAAVQGHVDRLTAAGRQLVIVSDAPEECALCRPWEGKVLAISASGIGAVTAAGVVTHTLAAAVAAGFQHPGCRHTVTGYVEGLTRLPTSPTADPAGDALRQQQRAFERRVRELRRRVQAVAGLDPQAERKARAQLRAKQQEFAAWRQAHDRKALPYRTQLAAR
jgi:hypothetical protein